MVDLGTFQALLDLPTERVAQAAAQALGFTPTPDDMRKSVRAAKPEELAVLAGDWRKVVDLFDDHTVQLTSASARTFANWRGESARTSDRYVADLVAAMGEQRAAMNELADVLDQLSKDLADAQNAQSDANMNACIAILVGIVIMVATVIMAAASGPIGLVAIIGVLIEFVLTLVFALVVYFITINNGLKKRQAAAKAAIEGLGAIKGAERVAKVTTPGAPDLTDVTVRYDYGGFRSQHMPEGIR